MKRVLSVSFYSEQLSRINASSRDVADANITFVF